MKTWASIIRPKDASTTSRSSGPSVATSAMVGMRPVILIHRPIATRTSRSSSASLIGDVLHHVELVVARRTHIAHAGLLHHPSRCDVLRHTDGDDLAQSEHPQPEVEAGPRGLGREAAAPPLLGEVIRDLDLRAATLDVHESAVADQRSGRTQLHRPQPETVLALVTHESLDRGARALDRWRRAARDVPHDLLIIRRERTDHEPWGLDWERRGHRYGSRHGAVSIGSSASNARSAAGHANQ